MTDFVDMYQKYKKKEQLNEFESNWKKGWIDAKFTKPRYHWEFKLMPATFEIDFDFKVEFKKDNILKDFALEDGKLDYTAFLYDVIKPAFTERSILMLARRVPVPGFKAEYATYGGELTEKSLDPVRKDKYHFTHIITFESKDNKRIYTKKEIEKLAKDFVKKFEPLAYSATDYYKISKK